MVPLQIVPSCSGLGIRSKRTDSVAPVASVALRASPASFVVVMIGIDDWIGVVFELYTAGAGSPANLFMMSTPIALALIALVICTRALHFELASIRAILP